MESNSLILCLDHTILTLYNPKQKALENTVGKGENAGTSIFFPFSSLFNSNGESVILATCNLLSANGFSLVMSKILLFGTGLLPCGKPCHKFNSVQSNYTTQNLLRITFSFNDLMLKTNRLKKYFFYKDRLIFGLDDPVANMSIWHVY